MARETITRRRMLMGTLSSLGVGMLSGRAVLMPAIAPSDATTLPHRDHIETATNRRAPTPAINIRSYSIGRSARNRSIEMFEVGNRLTQQCLLLIGCFHGDEQASAGVIQRIISHFAQTPLTDMCLLCLPVLNVDGYATGERMNSNAVDLNRNWPPRWQPDTWSRVDTRHSRAGGSEPFSEPECRVLRDFIIKTRKIAGVISYHTITDGGAVCPGNYERGISVPFARAYAAASSYKYDDDWLYYDLTGVFIDWLDEMLIPAIDVEFPSEDPDLEFPQNLRATYAALDFLKKRTGAR